MEKQSKKEHIAKTVGFFLAFSIFAISLRLFPHTPNYAAIGALAIFSGSAFRKSWLALLPLTTVFISDLLIGFYEPWLMATVYVSYAAMFLLGSKMNRKSIKSLVIRSSLGSILFFITTNFAVWAFASWYPHTPAGLLDSYLMGLPFYRNTFVSDLVFTATFVVLYEYAPAMFSAFSKKKAMHTV